MRQWRLMTKVGLPSVLAGLTLGCGALPRSQLARCHQHSQVLQAEASQLKNETLGLRDRNRELAQRALDDAHRIHSLEQSNSRLEKSLLSYQEERNRLVEAFEQLQSQIRTAAVSGPRRAGIERLESFVQAHPGYRFDAARGILSIPCELLFPDDSDALKPGAETVLAAFGGILSDPGMDFAVERVIVRYRPPSEVIRASADMSSQPPESVLIHRRAERVRNRLASALSGTPCRLDVAEVEKSEDRAQEVSLDSAKVIEVGINPKPRSVN